MSPNVRIFITLKKLINKSGFEILQEVRKLA